MANWLIEKQELFRKDFDAIGGIPEVARDGLSAHEGYGPAGGETGGLLL
jgi:hypothetical protein